MVAGNTSEVASQELCDETYALVKNNQSIRAASDVLTYPSAKKYVQRLMLEAPPTVSLEGKLAVVTAVARNNVSHYVAEELSVAAKMDLVLVGQSFPKLEAAAQSITDEFRRRHAPEEQLPPPKLYMVRMSTNNLRSVAAAAEEIVSIARDHYQGQVHILATLGGQVSEFYRPTEEGVEANLGHNYLAPRYLADLLLPTLRAAATRNYKPRLIQEASLGHCLGADLDPFLLHKCPKQGGAPDHEATFVVKEETDELEYSAPTSGLHMFYRSKMALMADTLALAREEPMLAVVSCDPGIVTYANPPPNTTWAERRQAFAARVTSVLDLSPSQAARSILRAALDPTLNGEDASDLHYLHSDGNPWRMVQPANSNNCNLDEYADLVRTMGEELLGRLLADYEWDFGAEHESSSSSLLGAWSPLSSPSLSPSGSIEGLSSMLNKEDLVSVVPAPPLVPAISSSSTMPSHSSLLQSSSQLWGRAFTSLLSQ